MAEFNNHECYSKRMDMKIELIPIPVTDAGRALAFYVDKIGFHLDVDHKVKDNLRFIQLTPPGSACSITFGAGIAADMAPGSIKGLQMVVADAQKAHDYLQARGVEVGDVEDMPWGRFIRFSDPDGNSWALQQLPKRG